MSDNYDSNAEAWRQDFIIDSNESLCALIIDANVKLLCRLWERNDDDGLFQTCQRYFISNWQ